MAVSALTAHLDTKRTFLKKNNRRSCFLRSIWVFPKIGIPQNGWFIMKNHIKIDDLGVPLFLETPIYIPRMKRDQLVHL